jgi:hypothetical protein
MTDMEYWWNDNESEEKPKYLGQKPVPVPLFSTTSSTRTGVGLETDLHTKRPADRRLELWHDRYPC